MDGFEKIIDIYENHYIPRFNLAALVIKKKISAHTHPEEAREAVNNPKVKFGLMEVPEIKQLVRSY